MTLLNLFLITGLFAFLQTWLLNVLLLKFSKTLGVHGVKDGTVIRWGSRAKPTIGGFGFYFSLIFSGMTFYFLNGSNDFPERNELIGLAVGISIAFFTGLADDAYDTRPLQKFLLQLLCGITLVFSGVTIQLFGVEWLDAALTIIWVAGLMNSVNMIDNMDGVAGMVSLPALLLAAFLPSFFLGLPSFLAFGMAASIIAFLFFNLHPSKLYMGDTGSMILGFFMAYLGIKLALSGPIVNVPFLNRLLPVILLFIVFFMDTSIVVIARLARKQSPFIGGKDHTTHHLCLLGIPEKLIPWLLTGVAGISGFFLFLLLSQKEYFETGMAWIFVLVTVGLMIFFYLKAKSNIPKPEGAGKIQVQFQKSPENK